MKLEAFCNGELCVQPEARLWIMKMIRYKVCREANFGHFSVFESARRVFHGETAEIYAVNAFESCDSLAPATLLRSIEFFVRR